MASVGIMDQGGGFVSRDEVVEVDEDDDVMCEKLDSHLKVGETLL